MRARLFLLNHLLDAGSMAELLPTATDHVWFAEHMVTDRAFCLELLGHKFTVVAALEQLLW